MKRILPLSLIGLTLFALGVLFFALGGAGRTAAQEPDVPDDTVDAPQDNGESAADGESETAVPASQTVLFSALDLIPRQVVSDAVNAAVDSGQISQEAADAILAEIDAAAPAPLIEFQDEFFTGHAEIFPEDLELFPLPELSFGMAPGHGFFPILARAQADGLLTEEDVQAVLEDFAAIAGEGVTVSFEEGRMEIMIDGTGTDLQEAMLAALDNAVADGRLSEADGEALKAEIAAAPWADFGADWHLAAPDLSFGSITIEEIIPEELFEEGLIPGELLEFAPGAGEIIFEALPGGVIISSPVDWLETDLDAAVADGRLSEEDAQSLRDLLEALYPVE